MSLVQRVVHHNFEGLFTFTFKCASLTQHVGQHAWLNIKAPPRAVTLKRLGLIGTTFEGTPWHFHCAYTAYAARRTGFHTIPHSSPLCHTLRQNGPCASCCVQGGLLRYVQPLGPLRGGYLGQRPGTYNFGAALNLTRVYL